MAEGPLVLVVEDEAPLRRFLRAGLQAEGYRVLEAASAAEAEGLASMHQPELLLLDLGLPDGDGLALLGRLRAWLKAPVIVVSARDQEGDKVQALDAGADDYLAKPFGMPELLARLRVARRHALAAGGGPGEPVLDLGGLVIDRAARSVRVAGAEVKLTAQEWKLLEALAAHPGKVLTHRQLLVAGWGPACTEEVHYLRVYMSALRRKLEPEPARPRWLQTEPGVGYRLRGS